MYPNEQKSLRRLTVLAALAAVPALATCGGGEPTGPGGGGTGTPRVFAVVYPAADTFLLHQSHTYSAWTQDTTGKRLGGSFTWSVSDGSILELAATSPYTVSAKALRAGTVTLTASSSGGYIARATVKVRPIFFLVPRMPSLFAGDTLLLTAWGDDGSTAPGPVQAAYSGGTAGIASVSPGGVVSGGSAGWATVNGRFGGESTSVRVAVLARPAGTNRELSYRCGSVTSRLCVAGASGVDTISPAGATGEEYAWSPDGSRLAIAYSSMPGGSPAGIYLSGPDGSGAALLVAGGRSPAWSPDGLKIAYEGSDFHVWVADLSSGAKARITVSSDQETSPQWSPDSRQLAYGGATDSFTTVGGVPMRVPTIRIYSGGDVPERELSLPFIPGGASWSPDGKYLAVSSVFGPGGGVQAEGVWLVEQSGSGLRPLSANCAADGRCSQPPHVFGGWANDGARFLWYTLSSGPPGADLFVIQAHRETGEISRFRTAACCGWSVAATPRWSPDGTLIAYFAVSAGDSSVTELRVANPDGTAARIITSGPGGVLKWRP